MDRRSAIQSLGVAGAVAMLPAVAMSDSQGLVTEEGNRLPAIDLGSKVRDRLTRFEGIVSARYERISGYKEVLVEGLRDENGALLVTTRMWFDSNRVDVLEAPSR